jgi:SSS family transporter
MAALGGVSTLFLIVVGLYFLVIFGIGYYAYRRTETEDDFLVANREIGPLVGAATLSATQLSAGTFVGLVGIHYLTGISFMWEWPTLWLGWIVALVFIAPQMRRFGELTVPDFLGRRYGDDGANGNRIRALGAVLIVLAYTIYISAQYTAAGLVFQSMFGIEQSLGMGLMVAVVLIYTVIGGMRASMLTDFVQLIVMLTGAFIAVPLILSLVGGISELNAMLASVNPEFVGWYWEPVEISTIGLAFGFSLAAAPNEIARIYSMRDGETVRTAIGLTLVFQVVIAAGMALVGMSMFVLFPELTTPDLASIIMSINVLGPVLGALLISAILSAMLSTVDSIMIVSASGIAHDLYAKIINPEATERQKLRVNRATIVILGLIPLALALQGELLGGLVQLIVLLQASMMGGMFFITILLGLHWKRATAAGGFAAIVAGLIIVLAWHILTDRGIVTGFPAQLDPVMPGVAVSFVTLVIVSLATEPPSRESLEPFFDIGPDSDQEATPGDD